MGTNELDLDYRLDGEEDADHRALRLRCAGKGANEQREPHSERDAPDAELEGEKTLRAGTHDTASIAARGPQVAEQAHTQA